MVVSGSQQVLHAYGVDIEIYQVRALAQGVVEVDVAVGAGSQAHGEGAVRAIDSLEVIILRLDSLPFVIEQEVEVDIVAVEQGERCLFVLFHVFLEGHGERRAAFGADSQFHHVVLDGHFFVLSLERVEEHGSGVVDGFRFLVGKSSFRFGFQVGFALLYQCDGVVVALLGFQLLLAGAAQETESDQKDRYQHQSGNGIFIHWDLFC